MEEDEQNQESDEIYYLQARNEESPRNAENIFDNNSNNSITDGAVEIGNINTINENDLNEALVSRPFSLLFRDSDESIEEHENGENAHASELGARDLYDIRIPAEHSYFQELYHVSGADVFEPGKPITLPMLLHNSIVFPGEIIPMLITEERFLTAVYNEEVQGNVFGLLFMEGMHGNKSQPRYGITLQMFERSPTAEDGTIQFKGRAEQRFKLLLKDNEDLYPAFRNLTRIPRATVTILPEIQLPELIMGTNTNYSVNKFNRSSMRNQIRHREATILPWPFFVFDQYDSKKIVNELKKYLEQIKIRTQDIPEDLTMFSFWCARNILLNYKDRIAAFTNNAATHRLIGVSKLIQKNRVYSCRGCNAKLGMYAKAFSMTTQGIQQSYCNPSGQIHETHTLHHLIEDSYIVRGNPSYEFSWFPRYGWSILLCKNCRSHIGWKFITQENLMPPYFYGLTASSVIDIID